MTTTPTNARPTTLPSTLVIEATEHASPPGPCVREVSRTFGCYVLT